MQSNPRLSVHLPAKLPRKEPPKVLGGPWGGQSPPPTTPLASASPPPQQGLGVARLLDWCSQVATQDRTDLSAQGNPLGGEYSRERLVERAPRPPLLSGLDYLPRKLGECYFPESCVVLGCSLVVIVLE